MSFASGSCELRVRYQETDCSGVVYHGGYFTYFEIGRTELLRSLGAPYRQLEDNGFQLAVVEAAARFLRPARYDDLLRVETVVTAVAGARVGFAYRVTTGLPLLATGTTTLACLHGETGRPRRVPPQLRDLLCCGPP
ncbi:MAG: thioesterase family protein [Planctomycetota bacterium]